MTDRERQIVEYRESLPKGCRKTYDLAMSGKSLRAAVNMKCFGCMNRSRAEIRKCTDYACPLFPYRPVRGISKRRRSAASILQNEAIQVG